MNLDSKKLAEQYKPKQVKVVNTDRQLCMVRYGPGGKILVAACQDATIRRWDEELSALPPLAGHGGWVQSIAFHADGRRLFAADSWGGLRCWPHADKEAKALWSVAGAHDGWIRGLAVSPDGKLVATCGRDEAVRLWSADDGKKVGELVGHREDVFAVAFHPDGKTLVSGDLKGIVKTWDLPAGKVSRDLDAKELHLVSRLQDVGGVRGLVFDQQGKALAVLGTKPSVGGNVQGVPTVLFFDWSTGKPQHTFKVGNDGDGFVYDLQFHPAGFAMAVTSGNPGSGKLFFFQPGDKEPFFQAAIPNCHSLTLHPGGQRLIVSATNGGSNGNGRVLKNGDYAGNFSPLHVWEMPKPAA